MIRKKGIARMATNTPTTSPTSAPPAWLVSLARNRKPVAYALFVAAVLLALIPVWIGYKYHAEYLSVCFWGGALALIALGAGIWALIAEPARLSDVDSMRLLVLTVGGLSGFATVVFLGVGLTWKWWNEYFAGGPETWQGKEGWRLWVSIGALLAGLIVMFVSLQLARTDEHSNSTLRRLLYGYNTVLAGLLLLLILVIVNAVVYVPVHWGPFVWFNTRFNWATASIYSLSPQSERILASLDKPLKIYVFMSQGNAFYHPTEVLLDNFREVNRNIQVKYYSPDRDREEIERLAKEYKFGGERQGILLLFGSEPKVENRFIKFNDLIAEDSELMSRSRQPLFKGEQVLINEINSLSQGKEKPVVYFTQGNGELSLSDTAQTRDYDKGLGLLKQRLEGNNYKIKGLRFSATEPAKPSTGDVVTSTKVPDDAATVVIAGPKERLTDPAINALRDYMGLGGKGAKKGKLIVMLDVVTTQDGRMLQTGLEPLLAEVNVKAGDDIILHNSQTDGQRPELVIVVSNPDQIQSNPIAGAFAGLGFRWYRVRSVEAQQGGNRPEANVYRAQPIFVADPRLDIWKETNLKTDPLQLLREFLQRGQLGPKLSDQPIPVVVAVSEMMPGGSGPHAFMQSEDKPRLVVFGDATWAGNRYMAENVAANGYYDLFASTLAWLREKPSNIGIEPKKRDFYTLGTEANVSRMVWLPFLLMVVGVLGLGTGVWVVRRR
jgi:hypothetical protein